MGTLDVADLPALTLKAIVWSDFAKVALINKARVQAGDTLAGCRVLAVEPQRVKLAWHNTPFYLRLP